ncbi:1,2-dihydroxy-3-keto-5-methylthiopentene dioxygenase [Methylomagnum ishizawai]|uniref:Acireductone dioxygenase n=1 Tax=Methylomagnum ishizawai TaxID=1760988 RepID=A0A1Y6CYP2_9GAMM|nr:cupin [Methylomagnum ishizawai]SMF95789.1 1,2-dihydroxy-3-keto-5-methylthiopentene dioxygenase [Methylomagnum ishizawai]
MSVLTIHPADNPAQAERITDPDLMAERLWEIGVLFERWQAEHEFSHEADQDTVIAAYRHSIDRLIDRYEFHSVDVVSLKPDHPQKDELRAKFLSEHTHDDFEVRFFVEGRGLFYLHAEGKVYAVLCEQGDLISVPDNIQHWFDMGENPAFKCIRFFATPEGWVANFTGSAIAASFPKFEQYLAAYA